MPLPNWLRRFPHPTYGDCGGASKNCAIPKPIDKMDIAFDEHDDNLYLADQLREPERTAARKEADKILAKELRKDLRPYRRKIYGPTYNFFAKLVFK